MSDPRGHSCGISKKKKTSFTPGRDTREILVIPLLRTCVRDWTEYLEEEARKAAWTLNKEIYNRNGTYQEAYNSNFLRRGAVKIRAQWNASHLRSTMETCQREYIVDSGAPVHMMGRSSRTPDEQRFNKALRQKLTPSRLPVESWRLQTKRTSTSRSWTSLST